MTGWLLTLWLAVARHDRLTGWLAAVLGTLALAGGATLGAARTDPPAFTDSVSTATVVPRRAGVAAVVVARRPAGFLVRTRDGDLLLVRTTERTAYRQRGQPADPALVRRGTRVLVLGRPAPREGVLIARAVVILGQPATEFNVLSSKFQVAAP